ncbi:MAG: AAA family ATPase [Candidatus Eremiobacterota bacterium]
MHLTRLKVRGYRCFGEFRAEPGPLEVIAGANGSGKTALFEFLRFLRDAVQSEIPPGL